MNYFFSFLLFIFSLSIKAQDFDSWKINFSKTLHKSKLNKSTIEIFLKHSQFNQKVLDLYNQQLSPMPVSLSQFLKDWFQSTEISQSWTGTEGIRLRRENRILLKKIEKHFKVDQSVIIALWGIESRYGKLTGNYPVLDSLSTLAFASKRKEFYSKELISALKIIQKNKIDPNKFLGSWAGAIGQCQFMPSNYFIYGVDFDKNHQVNLFDSRPDILASIANYLSKNKWQYKKPLGHQVNLPPSFNEKYVGYIFKDNSFWNKLNIRDLNQKKLPPLKDKSRIIRLTMEDINYLMAYKNFDVILRWNRSNLFVLKTILLKETIEKNL